MRKLWPFVGIALAVAGGIALAPFFWWIAAALAIVTVPLLIWIGVVVVLARIDAGLAEQQRRNAARVQSLWRPFLERRDRFASRFPAWFFWPNRVALAIDRVMGPRARSRGGS